jgi:hypothetical protein
MLRSLLWVTNTVILGIPYMTASSDLYGEWDEMDEFGVLLSDWSYFVKFVIPGICDFSYSSFSKFSKAALDSTTLPFETLLILPTPRMSYGLSYAPASSEENVPITP